MAFCCVCLVCAIDGYVFVNWTKFCLLRQAWLLCANCTNDSLKRTIIACAVYCYGVATISRLRKMIGLCCRISSHL